MAGLTKPTPRRDNPNLILVILLVIFVLATIGLGLWGYYGYDGQDKLLAAAKAEADKAEANKTLKDYYYFMAMQSRLIAGIPFTDENEKEIWAAGYSEFNKEKSKFEKFNGKQAFADIMEKANDDLGWDVEKYKISWKEKYDELRKENINLKGQNLNKEKELAFQTQRNNKIEADYAASQRRVQGDIKADNDRAAKAAQAKQAQYDEAFNRNSEMQTVLLKERDAHEEAHLGWYRKRKRSTSSSTSC